MTKPVSIERAAIAAPWIAVGWFARRWLAMRQADNGGGSA